MKTTHWIGHHLGGKMGQGPDGRALSRGAQTVRNEGEERKCSQRAGGTKGHGVASGRDARGSIAKLTLRFREFPSQHDSISGLATAKRV